MFENFKKINWPKAIAKTLVVGSTLALGACNGGAASSAAGMSSTSSDLQAYVDSLDFVPSNGAKASVGSKQLNLTQIGHQQSFTVVTPATWTGLSTNYYGGSTCLGTPVYALVTSGSAALQPGTYSTSDQSNYKLCTNYPGGCATLLSAAQAGTVKAMQYTYTFANGSSIKSACMSNITLGYDVLANYSTPASPVACTSGSSCGYSQAYSSTLFLSYLSTNINGSCSLSQIISGNVSCWGGNTLDQIGNGTGAYENIPSLGIMPTGVTAFESVSTNTNFSCAIASSGANAGKVYCWGTGTSGQIGNGAKNNVYVPTPVTMPSGVTAFSAISTNLNFSCALASAGANAGNLYCWGLGTSGQIGNGASLTVNVPTLATLPSGVTAFGAISTAETFSCALASAGSNAGKVYCWGAGTSGQIGNGANTAVVSVPTLATMPSGVTAFDLISTSTSNFSCALASAGESAGNLYCWGSGTSGKIGNGANSNVNVPTAATLPSGVTSFASVVTSADFSCAAAAAGANAGKLYCWGNGLLGKLGNGANSNVNVPTAVTMPSGVTAFGALSSNYSSTSCAIASSGANAGKVYCWGTGTSGQIGNGAYLNVSVPTVVTMPSGVTGFGSISTNSSFSCATASAGANAGKTYCWGLGGSGQIGNGAFDSVNVPTAVTMPSAASSFTSLSTNTSFSCAVASAGVNIGKLYCWGSGLNGQLGDNNVLVSTKKLITLPSGVTAFGSVSTNPNFSCAIASAGANAGKLYCWGQGTNGKIGSGTNAAVFNLPTLAILPSGVTAFASVSTNSVFSCAIASAGANAGNIYCWGSGTSGQIGNGASANVNVPTQATLPSGVTAFGLVSTNYQFSCAIASAGVNAGNLYCWGTGTSGQIGNGASANVNVPTQATLPSGVTAFGSVSTNIGFSCAIASAGANAGNLYCWGTGTNGEIGNGANASIVNVPTLATLPSGVTAFGSVVTSTNFSCAIASAGVNAGQVYCWGAGTNGEIGNGDSANVNVPTQATLPSDVTAFGSISSNGRTICAIASAGANTGKVYCWGLGTKGQIGNGISASVNVPTAVTMPSGVSAFGSISTNDGFSCAVASAGANAGKTYCWGTGTSGQIGNGAAATVNVPTLAAEAI